MPLLCLLPTAEANAIKKQLIEKALHQIIYKTFTCIRNSLNETPVVGRRRNDGLRGKLHLLQLNSKRPKMVKTHQAQNSVLLPVVTNA